MLHARHYRRRQRQDHAKACNAHPVAGVADVAAGASVSQPETQTAHAELASRPKVGLRRLPSHRCIWQRRGAACEWPRPGGREGGGARRGRLASRPSGHVPSSKFPSLLVPPPPLSLTPSPRSHAMQGNICWNSAIPLNIKASHAAMPTTKSQERRGIHLVQRLLTSSPLSLPVRGPHAVPL